MNKLTIPTSANWYEGCILTCATGNTVIYGARNNIVIIEPKPLQEANVIKTIYGAHKERVTSVATSPVWLENDKLFASCGDDNAVKLWNAETYEEKAGHLTHTNLEDKIAGISFAGKDKIVSVTHSGSIVVWRHNANTVNTLINMFAMKVNITSIAICPHTSWLTAFGLNNGLIIIADLRNNGRVMRRLKFHDSPVISLSWCPTPYNVYRIYKQTKKITKENCAEEPQKYTALDSELRNNILDIVNQNIPDDSTPNYAKIADQLEQISIQEDSNIAASANTVDESSILTESNDSSNKENDSLESKEDIENVRDEKTDVTVSPIKNIVSKQNPWSNLTFPSDFEDNEDLIDVIPDTDNLNLPEKVEIDKEKSFLQECEALKKKILKTKTVDQQLDSGPSTSAHVPKQEIEKYSETLETSNETTLELNTEVPKDFLLASATRGGKSIVIWRAGSDGLIQDELKLKGGKKQTRRKNDVFNKEWISICWARPLTLLSSSPNNNLLQWTLPAIGKSDKLSHIIHSEHSRSVFSISTVPKLYSDIDYENWKQEELPTVWTTGRDRRIIQASLGNNKDILSSYPTIGGQINTIVSSPVDPNRLALAVAENDIALWNLSRPHVQSIKMTNYSISTAGKIFTLAWHPNKENILAFGNIDGRVGIINTDNLSKSPTYMPLHSTHTVYALEWGPLKAQNKEDFGLYVSAGKFFVYNTNQPDEPNDIEIGTNSYVTNFSWKRDYSILAAGLKDGSVVLLNPKLEKISTLYGQQKSIQCLQWHPLCTIEDAEISPFSNYLAVGTASDSAIFIYDCSKMLVDRKSKPSENDDEEEADESLTILSGHAKFVKALMWSPHEGCKLISTSAEGVAQIWDVKNKTLLSSIFTHAFDILLTVLWSPIDSDLVITGGKCSGLNIWKISEHPAKLDSKEMVKKQKIKYLKPSPSEQNKPEIAKNVNKAKLNVLMPRISKAQSEMSETRLNDIIEVYNRVYETDKFELDTTVGTSQAVNLFGSRTEVLDAVNSEQEANQNRFDMSLILDVFKGTSSEYIKLNLEKGNVNATMVSVAASISHSLWQMACEAYAKKLSESPRDALESATYFLACHKVEEAVKVLLEANLFREALSLAKIRFPESDPICAEVITKWAKYTKSIGNLELAAQGFISLGNIEDAAKLLFKRNDKKTLEFAKFLAKKCDDAELVDGIEKKIKLVESDSKNETKENLVENETALKPRFETMLVDNVANFNNMQIHEMNAGDVKPNNECSLNDSLELD